SYVVIVLLFELPREHVSSMLLGKDGGGTADSKISGVFKNRQASGEGSRNLVLVHQKLSSARLSARIREGAINSPAFDLRYE
ncbi:hypothetical protein NDU88_005191, partial [Pleurodeles waltl]